MGKKDQLRMWQERLAKAETAYSAVEAKMDEREALYLGDRNIKNVEGDDVSRKAYHVRNIVAELVESEVDSTIPQPKVTARYKEDEMLAKTIEDMLRNELDRMPFEQINDMQERTVPIQGGALFLLEWDNTVRTHRSIGELNVSAVHPRWVIPQDGVYSGVEDMDYIILKIPQTKKYIERRYGVKVRDEEEAEPSLKSYTKEEPSDEMVTQYVGYFRNDNGGIGLYSWVNDIELESIDDYQARRQKRCKKCGGVQYEGFQPVATDENGEKVGKTSREGCIYCGSTSFEDTQEEFEEVYVPVTTSMGTQIPGAEGGVPTKIPYYKPDIYPVILQKNVSVFGQFLGDSDVDKIADQQNTVNRMEAKIIEKLLSSGSYLTLPDDAKIEKNSLEMKVIYPGTPADASMIQVHDMEGNISQDMAYLQQAYEEARQIIGITDSFQGRTDRTATSGKAKEFAAAQSAGRLESKRRMKDAAYAYLFEAMFKFKLAYTDEPRPVVSLDAQGHKTYSEFNKYDFLKRDENGEWYWNDQFLFAVDSTAPLAQNREAMWQETRMNFQQGAFGDPTRTDTLILFWQKMEMLHYPGASDTKTYLEERLQKEQMAQQMATREAERQMQEQQNMAIMEQARRDAMETFKATNPKGMA